MNPFNDIEQINFNPFNFFTDQDQQDMRDSELNYFNDLNSNNFDSLFVFEENVKRNICHIKKYDNLSFIHVHIRSMNSNFVIFFYIVRVQSVRYGSQIMTLRTIRISIYQTLALHIKKEKLAKRGAAF